MNKTELESKHLADLHALAADAGIPSYRMLPRGELIAKLASEQPAREQKPRPKRERRPRSRDERPRQRREREPAPEPPSRQPEAVPPRREEAAPEPSAVARPKRRRRRRWGRRRKGLRVNNLLLPAAPGRQALVYAESREGCTALLRGLAAELSAAADGADPIALLIDPSPEELGDWRREAPRAEIVAAGQARHADDALSQAARRAGGGEDIVVLIDSLSRFAESYGDADGARQLFDAGREAGTATGGSLTVVAAIERS